jgi:hypothetical protein
MQSDQDDTNEFLEPFRESSPNQLLPTGDAVVAHTIASGDSGEGGLPDLTPAHSIPRKEDIKLPPSLIRGVLHCGHKMVIGGGSKSYKSWSMIDLAISVASGLPWWGWDTQRSSVIYVNLEIQPEFFHHRLWEVNAAKKREVMPPDLYMWNLRGHYYDIEMLEANLSVMLDRMELDVGLLIIDPIYKAFAGDENHAGDVKQFLSVIEHFSEKTGSAICYGAHFSKGNQAEKEAIDRIAGSGVHARDPDCVMVMTKHEEENCFAVDSTIRNNAPVDNFVMEWGFPLMRRRHDLDPNDLKRVGGKPKGRPKLAREALLDKLQEGGMTSDSWAMRCPCGDTTFRKLRDELQRVGLIRKSNGLWYATS